MVQEKCTLYTRKVPLLPPPTLFIFFLQQQQLYLLDKIPKVPVPLQSIRGLVNGHHKGIIDYNCRILDGHVVRNDVNRLGSLPRGSTAPHNNIEEII